MKVILLPRELNSPDEPPEDKSRVFLLLRGDIYEIGRYYDTHGVFFDADWTEINRELIVGWWAIVQQ